MKCCSNLTITVSKSSFLSVAAYWNPLYIIMTSGPIAWRNSAVWFSLFWSASLVKMLMLIHIYFQSFHLSERFVFISILPGSNIFDCNTFAIFTYMGTAHVNVSVVKCSTSLKQFIFHGHKSSFTELPRYY